MTPTIYNYVFHYNWYDQTWYAIPTDSYQEYWNNKKVKGLVKGSSIAELIDIIEEDQED